MIRSFKTLDTRRFFEGERVPAFEGIGEQATHQLTLLEGAEALGDLAGLPSSRLERGEQEAGRHSIRIDSQWRICFRWTVEGGPSDVEIVAAAALREA